MKRNEQKFYLWGIFMLLLFAMVFCGISFTSRETRAASAPDIKIAAIYPLSGALSRNGNLELQSVKAAMGWVNDNGGIKSLGGAKLVPIVGDTGTSVEGAASATDRVCRDPDIVMAMGCWSSSLTLSATEIAERLSIPFFSISFADSLHERGFKWGFYVNAPSSVYGELGFANIVNLAKAAGHMPKTMMIVGSNQAADLGFYNSVKKYCNTVGIKVIGEETWATGTLTDATPYLQKVRNVKPELVLIGTSAIGEAQMVLMKKREMNIKIPFFAGGGWMGDPTFRQIGAEFLEGFFSLSPCFPHKLTPPDWIKRSLDQCRKEYSDEPWVAQELNYGWTTIPIMAEILERAGSRNKEAIWKAARALDISNVLSTRATAKQGMAFDERGRVVKKYQGVLTLQWQKGFPHVVYPAEIATAQPYWVKQ